MSKITEVVVRQGQVIDWIVFNGSDTDTKYITRDSKVINAKEIDSRTPIKPTETRDNVIFGSRFTRGNVKQYSCPIGFDSFSVYKASDEALVSNASKKVEFTKENGYSGLGKIDYLKCGENVFRTSVSPNLKDDFFGEKIDFSKDMKNMNLNAIRTSVKDLLYKK